jgi:hypothetical protein
MDDVAVVIRLAVDEIIRVTSVAHERQRPKRILGESRGRCVQLIMPANGAVSRQETVERSYGTWKSRLEQVSPDSAFCSSEMSREVT